MSTQIIRERSAQPDSWRQLPLSDEDYQGVAGAALLRDALADESIDLLRLPLAVWLEHGALIERFLASAAMPGLQLQLGLDVPTDTDPELVGDQLDRFAMIRVQFNSFADGRGYSLATRLRGRYGYIGELRAANVVPPNLAMLEQCGFDSFELAEGYNVEEAILLFDELLPGAA